jgi:hypothetical protein
MCPFCLATMGLVVAGAVSTGGLAALAVKVSRKKNGAEEVVPNQNNIKDLETDDTRTTSVRPCV